MDAYGEVLEASTQELTAECHTLYCAPEFGGFVRAQCVGSGFEHFGVVAHVATAPFDGSRVVQAHRLPPGELEQRKPHLATLLRTTFRARLIGYGQEGTRISGTPPRPAQLHCFVYPATDEEIRALTQGPAFLRPLVQCGEVSVEDLLVCAMRRAQQAWGSESRLVPWGKYLARLLAHDYLTLEGVLERLSPTPAPLPAVERAAAPPRWERPIPLAGNGPHAPARRTGDPFED